MTLVRLAAFALGLLVGACGSDGARTRDCSGTDLETRLACLPHVQSLQHCAVDCYQLAFEQPVDHDSPRGATFLQLVQARSISEDAPVVLSTAGYDLERPDDPLLARLPVNQVSVAHRYYGSSTPRVLDWSKLDIEESAADLHSIVTELKTIYTGKWLSAGGSKSGETAVFYRRFYPDDVDGTVANVAPNVHGLADPRFPPFLSGVGGDAYAACRSSLLALQRAVLSRRNEILPLMQGSFELLGKDVALEHMVLELPFDLWAYGDPDDSTSGCPAVPAADAPASDLVDFLTQGRRAAFSDEDIATLRPYAYEAATQLGNFAVDEAPLADLLQHGDTYRISSYAPKGVPLPFDARAMPDIQDWVATEGRSLLFIYGENDPWSAAMFELGEARDSYRFVQKKGRHSSRLAGLDPADKEAALDAISRWLEFDVRSR